MSGTRNAPHPTSPQWGEEKISGRSTMLPKSPARPLPLSGGGWVGVLTSETANDNLAPKRTNEEQSHG